ncbi:hypothetical protein [Streptomyces sp. SP18BB07]|uniref:hypothetical protein n=1 Tax=Streptomyces sp. SP18BB07 TaxID=3002522 RepID=UPI002E78AB75|nr:hypothetical protein [Streptomyces sp. SP18BB07]MEE1764470.1 hypothetical protein [Streptomyces sp. SP18BB07]
MITPEQLDAEHNAFLRSRALAALVREAARPTEREAFARIAAAFDGAADGLESARGDHLERRNPVRSAMGTVRELCEGTRLPSLLADYVTLPFIGADGVVPIQPDTRDAQLIEWSVDLRRRFDATHTDLRAADGDADGVRAALARVVDLQLEAVRLTAAIKGEGPGRRNWSAMTHADFDGTAPLALVDADAVRRPVPAVPDACGTEALFGDDPAPKRAPRTRRPAATPTQDTGTLF